MVYALNIFAYVLFTTKLCDDMYSNYESHDYTIQLTMSAGALQVRFKSVIIVAYSGGNSSE